MGSGWKHKHEAGLFLQTCIVTREGFFPFPTDPICTGSSFLESHSPRGCSKGAVAISNPKCCKEKEEKEKVWKYFASLYQGKVKKKNKVSRKYWAVCLTAHRTNVKQINNEKKQNREERRLCTPEPWMWERGRNPQRAWKRKSKEAPENLCANLPRSHPQAGQ